VPIDDGNGDHNPVDEDGRGTEIGIILKYR